MLNIFKRPPNREIDAFSRSLARELSQRYAVDDGEPASGRKTDRKLGKALYSVYSQARDFQRQHRLGVYGKARLANTFKWELKDMGYKDDFVEEATKGLVIEIGKKM